MNAFPRPYSKQLEDFNSATIDEYEEQDGMTMRQWYKGQALVGLTDRDNMGVAELSEVCGRIADAMIVEDKLYEERTSKDS